ncbi:MAG: protein jag [Tissierellia bacterium]|nr:protein jag [Tissierellia bacterium]
MISQTFTGKTVEEAIEIGLKEMDVKRDDVSINIVEEASKGILGFGKKDAVIEIIQLYNPREIVDSFISRIVSFMGLKANIGIDIVDNNMSVSITGIPEEEKGIIIGRRGATIDALQYLTGLVLNKRKDDYIRVSINVDDYREKREESLKKLADKMVERAKRSNRPVRLEPMNPYERRIIHSYLQGVNGIQTYSEGNEPYRKVVIVRK